MIRSQPRRAWSRQRLEEARKDSPIRAFGGGESAQPTRVPTSAIQNCERINLLFPATQSVKLSVCRNHHRSPVSMKMSDVLIS